MFKKLGLSIGHVLLKILGWKTVGEFPTTSCVVLAAPHTSNWDFVLFLLVGLKWGAIGKVVWIGKHTIFWGPLGKLFKRLGGVPVNRSQNNNIIRFVAKLFNERDTIAFALAPEGTRSYSDHWKKGFYHIARRANVPIALAFINFPEKTVGMGPLITLTGDEGKDWVEIRSFYQANWARYPDKFSDMKF